MARGGLGTWDWLERTGGKLAWRDRLTLLAQGVRVRAAVRFAGKARDQIRHIEVPDILPPDSAICRAAEALCGEASEPYLFNHCLRAYFWARLLNGSARFDDEAVYTALLLHDLGLTERYRRHGDQEQCFTLPAARAAYRLAIDHGWPDARARLAADAIGLHLNVIVDARHGREALLVRMGSGADVAGLGMDAIARGDRVAVVERYPRLGMKAKIHKALKTEVVERPCCRTAFLYTSLGFGGLIRAAPFAE